MFVVLLLSLVFAMGVASPPARAQAPSAAEEAEEAELVDALLNHRVIELYQAGKYSDAVPLAQQTYSRGRENAAR